MVSLCTGNRQEDALLDESKAREDAQNLYNAGEKDLGTDESGFLAVLGSQSFAQIALITKEYGNFSDKSLKDVIKSEFSGSIEKGLLAILKVAENRPAYFAEKLYKSMKGAGTNDQDLIRLVVSRCEVDMVHIKDAFQEAYGDSLSNFIQDDTSGDYKKMLLRLVN